MIDAPREPQDLKYSEPFSAPERVVIGNAELWHGDAMDVLPLLDPVAAVVTDPPYGLKFMGKRWDYDVPAAELWALVLGAMLPGAHLLAFAGTRTQHRMAVRIEDAGFEIRDMLAWVYGSGFPKSLDVGKAIDKAAGKPRGRELCPRSGTAPRVASVYAQDAWTKENGNTRLDDVPRTPEAEAWRGYGTALKPALEPITVARKPLIGTVAANVLAHGTGALNIDGCRVDAVDKTPAPVGQFVGSRIGPNGHSGIRSGASDDLGRWPANLIHDGGDEVLAAFPVSKSTARFFYCAKASKSERGDGNNHPTVKPTDLMRYLCRLVTPPGGIVLDPFLGSGSTGVAAVELGLRFVGIERDRKSFDIACGRIEAAQRQGRLSLAAEPGAQPPEASPVQALL